MDREGLLIDSDGSVHLQKPLVSMNKGVAADRQRLLCPLIEAASVDGRGGGCRPADRQRWLCPSTEACTLTVMALSIDRSGFCRWTEGWLPINSVALSIDTTSIWYCVLELHLAARRPQVDILLE
eukprot:1977106-Pleurochrysis_carterae.AAC.1